MNLKRHSLFLTLTALCFVDQAAGQTIVYSDNFDDVSSYNWLIKDQAGGSTTSPTSMENAYGCFIGGGAVGACQVSELSSDGPDGSGCLEYRVNTTFDAGYSGATLDNLPVNFWEPGDVSLADLHNTWFELDYYTDLNGAVDPSLQVGFELRPTAGGWDERLELPNFSTSSGWETARFNLGQDATTDPANFLALLNANEDITINVVLRIRGSYDAGRRLLVDNVRIRHLSSDPDLQWSDDFDDISTDAYQTRDWAGNQTDSGNLPFRNSYSQWLSGSPSAGVMRIAERSSDGVGASGCAAFSLDAATDASGIGWEYSQLTVGQFTQGQVTMTELSGTTISFDALITDAAGNPAPATEFRVNLRAYNSGGWADRLDVVQNLSSGAGWTHVEVVMSEGGNVAAFLADLNANFENRLKIVIGPQDLATTISPGDVLYIDNLALRYDSNPGTVFCGADGVSVLCPCGNQGSSETGCANGGGLGAHLRGFGEVSVSADSFVLSAVNLVSSQPGLYFQGNNQINSGAGVQFGDGLRCAGGGVIRLQVRFADLSGWSATTAAIALGGGVTAGDTKRYQLWYRDPQSTICGTGFNLSNGYEVVWLP
jgi:hypothetical protein